MTVDRSEGFFYLYRDQDVSGVSGTGMVASGAIFRSGKVALCWHVEGKPNALAFYDCIDDLLAIHGHGGATHLKLVWQKSWQEG